MSNKPEKIRYSKAAVMVDGIQLKRVQTFGHNSDLSSEKLLELSNSQATQFVDNVPNVSITIDTNDIGSIDTLRIATNKLVTDATGPNDVRTGGFYSKIKDSQQNVNTAIDEDDLLQSKVDLMLAYSEDGTNVDRTAWFHNCALSGISWNYDVNGFAQENYSFTGDNRTWFLNGWKGARGILLKKRNIGGFPGLATHTSQTFYIDSACVTGLTDSVIAVGFADNIAYRNDTTNWQFGNLVSAASNGKSFRLGLKTAGLVGTPFASSATGAITRVFLVLKPNTTQTWAGAGNTANPGYTLTSVATTLGGLPREFIKPVFWNPSYSGYSSVNPTLRLQSVSIDISPGAEPLNQLSAKSAYSYDIEEPLPITVTMSALDSDLEIAAYAMGTALSAPTTMTFGDLSTNNRINIYSYRNKNKANTDKLKVIRMRNMKVTGINDNVSVGGNATTEWTFECSNIVCSGTGIRPIVV